MNIPATLTAGDTWSWSDSHADYLATEWTLKYVLYRYGQAAITITAVANGTGYDISVPVSTTKGKAAGEWNWSASVVKDVGLETEERHTIGNGTVTIKPDLAAATASSDFRSHAQIVLDAIQAVIQNRATSAQSMIAINGKQIQYYKLDELQRFEAIYQRRVDSELGKRGTIRFSFGSG